MAGWFDSHCHVQEEYLRTDDQTAGDIGALLSRASESGVDRLVCIGTGAITSAGAVAVAQGVADVGCGAVRAWASVGLHPHEASDGVDAVAALLATEMANP